MSKDTKAQVKHAHKEIKDIAYCIVVMKKQKGTPVDNMAMMNTSLEEAKGRLVHYTCGLLDGLKKEVHKKMLGIVEHAELCQKIL